MKKAKVLLVGIILILVRVPEAKAIGWDHWNDWTYTTWNGTRISQYDIDISIHYGKEKKVQVGKWYYFKNKIVGVTKYQGAYFILNEKTKAFTYFRNKEDWDSALYKNNLKPKIYTRWYSSHIGDGNAVTILFFKSILFICFFCPPILLIFWIIYRLFEPGLRALLIIISLLILEIFFSDWFVFSF